MLPSFSCSGPGSAGRDLAEEGDGSCWEWCSPEFGSGWVDDILTNVVLVAVLMKGLVSDDGIRRNVDIEEILISAWPTSAPTRTWVWDVRHWVISIDDVSPGTVGSGTYWQFLCGTKLIRNFPFSALPPTTFPTLHPHRFITSKVPRCVRPLLLMTKAAWLFHGVNTTIYLSAREYVS